MCDAERCESSVVKRCRTSNGSAMAQYAYTVANARTNCGRNPGVGTQGRVYAPVRWMRAVTLVSARESCGGEARIVGTQELPHADVALGPGDFFAGRVTGALLTQHHEFFEYCREVVYNGVSGI